MNKLFLKIICLLVALCLMLSAVGCSKKKPETTSSNSSDEITSEDSSSLEDDSSDESEETLEDEFVDYEEWEDVWDDDYSEPEKTYSTVSLKLKNASAPIQEDFLGFNAIYHAYTYRDDAYGRVHNEQTATAELDAVKASGINIARTLFTYDMAWDSTKKQWNWDSKEMQAFYRWCKELKARDIDVMVSYWNAFREMYAEYIQVDHTLKKSVYVEGRKPECFWVEGNQQKTLDNFGDFWVNLFKVLRSKGLTNVKYIAYSTEPGFSYLEGDVGGENALAEKFAKEFLGYANAVHRKLKKANLRQHISVMGPNEAASNSGLNTPGAMMRAVARLDTEGAVDLYSSHNYYTTNDVFTDYYYDWYDTMQQKMGEDVTPDKFVFDEYGVSVGSGADKITEHTTNPYLGTHSALMNIAALNSGLRSTMMWTLVSQQWPNNRNNATTDKYVDGVHVWGILPNFHVSNIPYPSFYAFQLYANFLGKYHSKIYSCDYGVSDMLEYYDGVYMAMSEAPDGNIGIMAVNSNLTAVNLKVELEKALGKTLYRYEVDPSTIVPTQGTEMVSPSAKFKCEKKFHDVVPAFGMVVYTTQKP